MTRNRFALRIASALVLMVLSALRAGRDVTEEELAETLHEQGRIDDEDRP